MAKKKKEKYKAAGTPSWMVSMGDLNNLLMCFFIVLMGDIVTVTQEDIFLTMTSFRGSLGVLSGGRSLSKGRLAELGNSMLTLPSEEKKTSLAKALKKTISLFKPEIESKLVRVYEDERGLIITLMGDIYFERGSARMKPEFRPILKKVGAVINPMQNFVRIEGHTDDTPSGIAKNERGYETNWELSGARSINILRFLTEEEGVTPEKMSASAFGEYRPIDINEHPDGQAYNRRVDIVILKERFLEKGDDKRINRPLPDEEWR